MRYRLVAKSIADRRRILAIGDDGQYYILSLSGLNPTPVRIDSREAQRMQFDRTWVPVLDHTPRTMRDLSAQLTYQ